VKKHYSSATKIIRLANQARSKIIFYNIPVIITELHNMFNISFGKF